MSEKKQRRRAGRMGRSIRKWIKRLILLVLLLAAALFGLKAYIGSRSAASDDSESYAQARVRRGTIQETVYGTGTTSARSQPNVLAEAEGTLTDLRVSIGDEVKKGDIFAVLTNDEIDDQITDLEFALWDLDAQITDTTAGTKVTRIDAPAAGRIVAVYAKAGDEALAVFRREGALAIISTDGRMKVEITGEEGALGLTLDEKVTVVGNSIRAEGTVVELTRQGTHAVITIMESELPMSNDLDGDGSVDMILGAAVEVQNARGQVIGTGNLEANKPMAVSAFGGTIDRVDAVLGAKVARSERLFRLADSPLTLKIENLRLQREAAAKELDAAIQQRENLIVLAPCDGVVASLDVAEGDELSSGTLIGSILEGEDMNLTISVDELDVVKVKEGQTVSITVDALSSLELLGEVYKLAPVGESSGGVTTYKVELTFDAAGTGVRSGMNATGEIQVAEAQDTLYVPVEALMTINNQTYVMVADGGTMTLTDAAQSGRQRSSRAQSGAPSGEGMTEASMPSGGERPDRSQQNAAGSPPTNAQNGSGTEEEGFLAKLYAGLHAWLYEGVQESAAQQVTGSLVKVEVGLKNDDYAEITSGVSEGDTVLYTASESSRSSSNNNRTGSSMMMGGFGGGASMGGR